jgi:hypothetical protein
MVPPADLGGAFSEPVRGDGSAVSGAHDHDAVARAKFADRC